MSAEAISLALVLLALISSILLLAFAFSNYFSSYINALRTLAQHAEILSSSCIRFVQANYSSTPQPSITAILINCGSREVAIDNAASMILVYSVSNVLRDFTLSYGSDWYIESVIVGSTETNISAGQPVTLSPGEKAVLVINLPTTPDSNTIIRIYLSTRSGVTCSYVLTP